MRPFALEGSFSFIKKIFWRLLFMKKSYLSIFLVVLCLALTACGGQAKKEEGKTLKVAATAVPHAEILNFVKPLLAKEKINLTVVEMADYVRPNVAVAEKELDANFFQHTPYLEKFVKDRKVDLVKVNGVHVEPMGIYSKKIKDLKDLPAEATISIPNDPTNGGRALLLLEKAGVIKLKDKAGITATVQDIAANPKNVKIKEIEAPQLPRTLDDVTLAVINTNYALDAKLNPTKDALVIEDKNSPYVNILVCRKGEENRPEIQALAKVLNSPEVKKFIEEKYKGAVVAAF